MRTRTKATAPDTADRPCDTPGCEGGGAYRAPRRDVTGGFYWFCLEHVRAYNASWDYFRGMDAEQIEAHVREDAVWHRPTWPLGSRAYRRHRQSTFDDPFDVTERRQSRGRSGRGGSDGAEEHPPFRAGPDFNAEERRAVATLGLELPVSFAAVKARYRSLVKRLHPDANGSDPTAEEKLKRVNRAYTTLKHSGRF